jgi:glycerate dehydrogenase
VHRIVFLDRAILPLELRRPGFDHEWAEYPVTKASELDARLRDATIVISSKIALRRETLARFPQIRLIAIAGTGYDAFDIEYCRAQGIAVTNVRDYARHTVPEHTFALILALRRNLIAYRADVEAGLWQRSEPFCLLSHPIGDLHGQMIGAFGMRVAFADHPGPRGGDGPFLPLPELLAQADVVALHCPLTERTRNLIGERELRAMKRSALLVNAARGGLVDEVALARALTEGWIAGAGVDVLSTEPPRAGNPLLDLRLPNLIVTPHVAWAGDRALAEFAEQLIANIEHWVAGAPRNLVN